MALICGDTGHLGVWSAEGPQGAEGGATHRARRVIIPWPELGVGSEGDGCARVAEHGLDLLHRPAFGDESRGVKMAQKISGPLDQLRAAVALCLPLAQRLLVLRRRFLRLVLLKRGRCLPPSRWWAGV